MKLWKVTWICIWAPVQIFSQLAEWSPVANFPAWSGRQIFPKNLSGWVLYYPNKLSSELNQFNLPNPDGQIETYRLEAGLDLHPDLQNQFPEIKTFRIKNKHSENGTLVFTPFGIHAQIFSKQGCYFIDPVFNTSDRYYQCYYVKDYEPLPGSQTGSCKTLETPPYTAWKQAPRMVSGLCTGSVLRNYRIAIACTGEYAKAATGLQNPTLAQALSKIAISLTRVNGVYEMEASIRMQLVPTESLIVFTNPATDPFTGNSNANILIGESQSVITSSIGSANFDIGHTFSTGGGGLAALGCVCYNPAKASGITGSGNPVGDPFDIDYVAHEIGHQFGGDHTFNANTGSCNGNVNSSTAVEPGSGITIMAYAGICGSTDNLAPNSIAHFHATSYDQITQFTHFGLGAACAQTLSTGNQPPQVWTPVSQMVPVSTPFYLSGIGLDPDGDTLRYSWEETDAGTTPASWNSGQAPYFRSYPPVLSATRMFPNASVVLSGNYKGTRGEYLPSTPQILHFRLTARDQKLGGGGVCYSQTDLSIEMAGPLEITYPSTTGIVWSSASTQTVLWDVNFTDLPPLNCDSVKISISLDNGLTYSVLNPNTKNDGFEAVQVPSVVTTVSSARIKIEPKLGAYYTLSKRPFTIVPDLAALKTEPQSGFNVYPNPSEDVFQWSGENVSEIKVFEPSGKCVQHLIFPVPVQEGNIKLVSQGVYILRFKASEQLYYKRIIKN